MKYITLSINKDKLKTKRQKVVKDQELTHTGFGIYKDLTGVRYRFEPNSIKLIEIVNKEKEGKGKLKKEVKEKRGKIGVKKSDGKNIKKELNEVRKSKRSSITINGLSKEDLDLEEHEFNRASEFYRGNSRNRVGALENLPYEDTLEFYMRMKKEAKDWLESLNKKEKDALHNYHSVGSHISMGFNVINPYLRGEGLYEVSKKELKGTISSLDSAIEKFKIKKDTTVYRGFIVPYDLVEKDGDYSSWEGKIIQDKGFISTSIDPSVAVSFLLQGNTEKARKFNTMFKLELPKGTKAAPIAVSDTGYAEGPTCGELLLKRGTSFLIKRVERVEIENQPPSTIFHAEIV